MATHMIFRPNTYDESIWGDSTLHNAYGLPLQFEPNAEMIDIGCHIGSVTYEAIQRGVSKVYAYEASIENYRIAMKNLAEYIDSGKVELFNLAVWDRSTQIPLYKGPRDSVNTGGFSLFSEWDSSENMEMVNTISLDEILERIVNFDIVDFLKFDCEGAEYRIFYNSKLFQDRVRHLVGETHTGDGIGQTHELAEYLKKKGYVIKTETDSPLAHLGWIDAELPKL